MRFALTSSHGNALLNEQYGVEHSDIAHRDAQILAFGEDILWMWFCLA